jgi:hypothetical protein
MAIEYPKVGVGHDIVLGLLDTIMPVPSHQPVAPVQRFYSAGTSVHDQGKFVVFHWDVINDLAEYTNILDLFGLLVNPTSEVTVHVKNERLTYTLYNGTAYLPESGSDLKWSNFFARDINLYVCDLETF